MNQLSAMRPSAPKYFLRTPQGRKGVDLPKDMSEVARDNYLIQKMTEEANEHGYAILDRVETHPVLQIMRGQLGSAEEIEASPPVALKKDTKPARKRLSVVSKKASAKSPEPVA